MKLNNKVVGNVYEIRDLVSDEAIVPQFCSKTEENAKRQFAIFLSQNKFKPCDFELRVIGEYYDSGNSVCRGSDVLISNYMKDEFEPTVKEA